MCLYSGPTRLSSTVTRPLVSRKGKWNLHLDFRKIVKVFNVFHFLRSMIIVFKANNQAIELTRLVRRKEKRRDRKHAGTENMFERKKVVFPINLFGREERK